MKKLLALIASALFATGLVFAEDAGERSIHWLGFNTAWESQNWLYDSDYDSDLSFFDFNIFYNHNKVGDNRFSKIVDVQFGYQSSSGEVYMPITLEVGSKSYDINQWFDVALSGVNTRWMFGLGFAPLNIDRVVLSVNGTFGVQLSYLTGTESYYFRTTKSWFDFDETLFGLGTFIGANCQCAVRLGDSIGLSAGIHMYTNLFGFGVTVVDWSDDSDAAAYVIMPGNFNIDLKFGVAWIY